MEWPLCQMVVCGLSIDFGQPLDPLARHLVQGLSRAFACNQSVGSDLSKRHQHEGAREQARVGKREPGSLQGNIVIGDQIEIERTRTPARFLRAVAAEALLDALQNR